MAKIEKTLSTWASNPAAMLRLEEILKLTQRTSVIMSLLSIRERDRELLRSQCIIIAERCGFKYQPSRGLEATKRAKQFTAQVRTSLAYMINILGVSDDAGLARGAAGAIVSEEWVDRLINAYHLYLQDNMLTPANADVPFELLVHAWRAIQNGHAQSCRCENCGSIHYEFSDSPASGCPVCRHLGLAILPKQSASGSWARSNLSTARAAGRTSQLAIA